MVVLATACVPNRGVVQIAEILGIEINDFGFFKTAASHPLDTTRPGIFACGCAHGPRDIPESVAQASGAAARAAQITIGLEMRQAS
jgi:heterodisulfide reductase subunit A